MFSGERLKQLRKEKGLTQMEIAQQLEINRASYASWELGRAKPNQSNLERLGSLFGVENTYFESEYMIVSNYLRLNQKNRTSVDHFVEELLKIKWKKVLRRSFPLPYSSVGRGSLICWIWRSYYDEYWFSTVYSDEEYSYDFASFIVGQSMEPTYSDGEVALFSSSGYDYDGAVYAISLNGKAYIKRVYKEKNRYRIVSINPKYPDIYAYESDEFKIVGKVVGHFRPIEKFE